VLKQVVLYMQYITTGLQRVMKQKILHKKWDFIKRISIESRRHDLVARKRLVKPGRNIGKLFNKTEHIEINRESK
jgi:hypothetical protein